MTVKAQGRKTTNYLEHPAPAKWTAWADLNAELSAAVDAVLRLSGELFGMLTLTDGSGVPCSQYRVDPMVKAQFMEHAVETVEEITPERAKHLLLHPYAEPVS